MKQIVALFMPPELIPCMFHDHDLERLRETATVKSPAMTDAGTAIESTLFNAHVAITGWGTPLLSTELLNGMPNLKLIAHSAGSVKSIVTTQVFDRGIRVTTAASANAHPVAEFTIAMMVSLLKQVPWISPAYIANDMEELSRRKRQMRELTDLDIGIVGASHIGMLVIKKLQSFNNLVVKVYDPTMSVAAAKALGVNKCSIEEVCACDVLSIHAPSLPSTKHIINEKTLALLPDHGVLINTSRGELIDEDALLLELHKRPIYVALDVTTVEPLPDDSPLRRAPNLVLTPHIAGAVSQARKSMGRLAIDETTRFLTNQKLEHEVTREMMAVQA